MIIVRRSAMRSLISSIASVAAIGLLAAMSAGAQTPAVAPQTRITQAIDENNLITLKGNTHPFARAEFDQGAAPDNEPANRIMILLKRSDAQEAALRQLIDEQKSSSSPNFQKWLTPAQFGQQFGPSDSDIQTLTSWLTSHGFTVNRVSAGRTLIEISGTAGMVREAFHTQIHRYMVNGQAHWANSTDPQIPAALAPVMAGPVTLHNFGRKPLHTAPSKIDAPTRSADAVTPELTASCGGTPCYLVGPTDFSVIYNTAPLWTAGIDGTGQSIAIVGDSNIVCSDVVNFRTFFGLPTVNGDTCTSSSSNVQIFVNGPDPGLNGDEIEADLDVEWSGAVAKGAHIDFVTSEGTEVSQGVDLSAEYIIDNDLAPVMSESFGACEGELGNGGNDYYASLWEQAAAEGITVMVSAGDSGAAGCDDDNSEAVSEDGLAVSGISSTPFNVAVGGTDFNDFTNQTTYWNCMNTVGSAQQSVKGYVPEIPWDDSCAASSVTGCTGLTSSSAAVNIVGGGGGQSNCAGVTGNRCTAYYPRPSWQKGAAVTNALATETPGPRNVPDVSLFAAAGSGSNSFYPICESDQNAGNAGCTAITFFVGVGGTSSSSPAFAGIMSMVNQYMASLSKPSRQGNANYELYTLAGNQVTTPPSGGCNSTSSPNTTTGTGCTFYDITIGSNSVPCVEGLGCTIQNVNATSPGVLEEDNFLNGTFVTPATLAWQAGTGYDFATGLGSVNAYNLVHNWPAVVGAFTPTATTLKLCSPSTTCVLSGTGGTLSITHGATVTVTTSVAPTSGSGTPTGDVSLIGTPNTLAATNGSGSANAGVDYFTVNSSDDVVNFDVYTLTSGTVTGPTTSLVGGNYAVTANYAGDGTFGGSVSPNSPAVNVSVAAEPSTTTVTFLGAVDPNTDSTVTSSVPYGFIDVLRVDVVGKTSGQETASGNVALTDNSSAFGCPANPCTLNPEGNLEVQAGVNVIPTFATGAHSFAATYAGDASYATSATTSPTAVTIVAAATKAAVAASPNTVASGNSTTLTATIIADSIGVAPTGTVTFFANGVAITTGTVNYTRVAGSLLGTPLVASNFATVTATLNYTPSATTTITAMYNANGDPNYTSSAVSGGQTLTVTGASGVSASLSTVSASSTSIIADGATTSTITVTLRDSNSNPVSGKTVALTAGSGSSTISAASGSSNSSGVVTFTVKDAHAETVVYAAKDTTDTVTVAQTTAVTFVPYIVTSPNSSSGTAENITAPGQSGVSTLSVAVGTGQSITFTAAVTSSPAGAIDTPTCGLSINPVSSNTNNEVLTCNTTAAMIPPAPLTRLTIRMTPLTWVVEALGSFLALLILLALPERRSGYAMLILALFVAVGAGVACGGGGGSSGGGGGGGGGGGALGTTVGVYQVTVTGSVAGGTPVIVFFNVQ